MKFINSLVVVAVAIAPVVVTVSAQADTVDARCDVYPAGQDQATSSGPCTFSQRQGIVGIQLQDGRRYDLNPVGDQPGNYVDQNGRAAYRQAGLGDAGQIYRLADESIYVYWAVQSGQNQDNSTGGSATSASQPAAGTTVPPLSDLVGAKAGQAEGAVTQRGYQFVKSSPNGDSVYSYWLESGTNYCVTIRTEQGRYQSIVYAGGSYDCEN